MRQRLLQHLSLAKPLRLALVLFTLLLTLPQTAWGEEITKTITFNKTINTVNSGINNSTMSVSINEQITGVASPSYDGEITILDNINGINSYSCSANGAVFKMNGSSTNSTFSLKIPGNYPAKPSKVIVKAAYANGALASNSLYYFKIGVDDEYGDTYHYKLTTGPSNDNVEAEFTADGSPRTNRNSEGPLIVDFVIKAIDTQSENDRTTITVKEISITYTREVYGITVAGTSVKSDNATDILGDGKVSYNATTKTLKLDGANINYTSGDAITASTTDPLNVNVVGANSISCGDHKAFNTNGNLVFQTSSGVAPGQLTITSTSNIDPQSYYTCAGSVSYQNGLAARNLTSNSVLISTNYGINVGGTVVTSDNATDVLNNNTVSYDASDNILTLDGATISGAISTERDNLTIKLKGTNTITTTNSYGVNGIISDKNTGTLTFTKEGANASLIIGSNVSVIRGFANLGLENSGLYTNTSTPYKIKNDSSYPRLADATTSDTDTTAIKNITISDVATYQLWVSGVQVTEGANITGAGITGTVTFNASNNTLSLNGASISGILLNNLDELKIEFTGANSITNNYYITSLNTNAALTMSGTGVNSTFAINTGTSSTCAVSGFASVTLSDGTYLQTDDACRYKPENKAYIKNSSNSYSDNLTFTTTPYYPLWVYDTQVSSNYNNVALTSGTASYDATNHILTFENAVISSSNAIESELSDFLVIALKGNNRLEINTGSNSPIMSGYDTATLTIKKADINDINDCQLELGFYGTSNPPVIKGFKSVDYTGLNFVSKTATSPDAATATDATFSSATIYPLWVAGTMVTGSASSGAGWSYDGNTNTLTLDNYTSSYDGHAFAINMPSLNVYLKGTNTIGFNNIMGSQPFYSYYNDATLTFSTDENNMGKLDASYYGTFCNGYVNTIYCNNGLGYYPSDRKIEAKKTPTIKFVERDQTTSNIPNDPSNYVYVAENGTIEMNYVSNFYAPKPIFSNDYQLSDSTRYEYSMSVNDVVAFTLGGTTQGNPGKIDYADNGEVSILKSGTVTITCTFPGNMQNKPCSASYTFKITRDFNNPFANQPAEQIYATYYNGDEDLTLPDGITAYVITGLSGNTVTTTATGYLPHEVPVLLEKTGNVGTTITGYTGSAGNFSGNLLKYADQTFSSTGKEYVLYMNEFVKATGDIPNSKCYLDMSSVNPTRGMYGIGDGTTSIRELRMENEGRDEWYDLQGRRIEQPTKAGLYIKNGKKVIVNIK